jgi:glycosyltransferase involved in cell wall biosynthesis
MDVELLVAAMHANPEQLFKKMNLSSDAIIINQCDVYDYQKYTIQGQTIHFYSMNEKGVGLSRNNALLRASHTISLFSDSDIEYYDGYQEKIINEFQSHPNADMILFNFDVIPARQTYHTKKFHKISFYNCGRYPTFSFAIKTTKMHANNLTFSLLFGGGAKYSNGEDSLFLRNCLRAGLHVFASPICLGKEDASPSTWFHGYNEKFFHDRGVLYHFLYGNMAKLFGFRFIYKHKKILCDSITSKQAYKLLCEGIKTGKNET